MRLDPGAGLRVDAGVEAGDAVTPFYNSMIAKLIAHAPTRAEALAKLRAALARAVVIGPKTNLAFLSALLSAREVEAGAFDTGFIDAQCVAARRRAARGRPARHSRGRRGAASRRRPRDKIAAPPTIPGIQRIPSN